MNSDQYLNFFQKVTRRLADTFEELNQLCVQEINNVPSKDQPQQSPSIKPADVSIEIPFVQPIPVEEPQEQQPAKSQKTKKIKKEGSVQEQDKQSQTGKSKKKVKKVSHKPKAPPSSFLLFFKDQQSNIAQAYPTYGVTQLTKVAAKLWSEYSAELKAPYIKMCDQQRRLYQERMQKYRIQFPQEIAEKQKDRLSKRKLKNGNKQTPKKDKPSPDTLKSKSEPEVKNQPNGVQPPMIPEESISQSNSVAEIDEEDSLGII